MKPSARIIRLLKTRSLQANAAAATLLGARQQLSRLDDAVLQSRSRCNGFAETASSSLSACDQETWLYAMSATALEDGFQARLRDSITHAEGEVAKAWMAERQANIQREQMKCVVDRASSLARQEENRSSERQMDEVFLSVRAWKQKDRQSTRDL